MSGLVINITLDRDMKYAYVENYCYGTRLEKIIEIEQEYDTLSVVKPGQLVNSDYYCPRIRKS
jgi:hypothetical protein